MSMLRRWTGRRSNGGMMESSRHEMEGQEEMGEMARPLMNLQERINDVFDDFFNGFPMPMSMSMGRGGSSMGGVGSSMMRMGRFQPRMDLSETAEAFKITADVPGMSEKDIDITVSDDALTVHGERSEKREEDDENYYRRERSYGMFHRRLPMPGDIERDKISANFKNGVLTIELPKSEEAKRHWRKIEVKSG